MRGVTAKKSETIRFAARPTHGVAVQFGTKAETLERFQSILRTAAVPDLEYFAVPDWLQSQTQILAKLAHRFGEAQVVVRSSACHEDGSSSSLAGAFTSILGVCASDGSELSDAISQVLTSYPNSHPQHQILVQRMVEDVEMSGVVMTHDLTNGAPYYIVNYDDDSGRTDVITGGTGTAKSLVVHRDTSLDLIESPRIAAVLEMVRELESLTGGKTPLDIEFALDKSGVLHLLQVRRIAVQRNWNRAIRTRISEALEQLEQFIIDHSKPRAELPGTARLFGQMPDWNVAELIGAQPAPLALSLFRTLISDSVWQEARASMGYQPVPDEPLVVTLAGRPYIDVRNSFTSFLPAGLALETQHRIVSSWMDRLGDHPEFHDKVEFEVAQTVYDFQFQRELFQRYPGMLDAPEHHNYTQRLHALTLQAIDPRPKGSLARALKLIERTDDQASTPHENEGPLRRAFRHLTKCREYGTKPFATIARHAFIAESFLRSAIACGALESSRVEEFKRSLVSPAGMMARDYADVTRSQLSSREFLVRYGHLRPGTFDIVSPRYDQREDLFSSASSPSLHSIARKHERTFAWTTEERSSLDNLARENQLPLDAATLQTYATQAIEGREHAKFRFTKVLSDSLECIAEWGECRGLTRDDLSFLTIHDLRETLYNPLTKDWETALQEIVQCRRIQLRELRALRLGYIIRDVQDLYVVPQHRGAANFVTSRTLEGVPIHLDLRLAADAALFGKIVCIDSADPGYDWIFTRGIAGLITKFGGSNSHMTIRCAELGIPAAIGVGESLFERLTVARRIELRCNEKVVRPVGP